MLEQYLAKLLFQVTCFDAFKTELIGSSGHSQGVSFFGTKPGQSEVLIGIALHPGYQVSRLGQFSLREVSM